MQIVNSLLAELAQAARSDVTRLGETVALRRGDRLTTVGETPRFVYFPRGGMISVEASSSAGHSLELAGVGREGLVGLSAILGAQAANWQCVVRAETLATRVRVADLRPLLQVEAARTVLLSYAGRVIDEVVQVGFCNGSHAVLERLCRWLLTTRDCLDADCIQVTQSDLMQVLGVAHTAVRKAVADLEHADAILSSRGRMLVRSLPRLEKTTCDCYRAIRVLRHFQTAVTDVTTKTT